jgi:hypothetical protein
MDPPAFSFPSLAKLAPAATKAGGPPPTQGTTTEATATAKPMEAVEAGDVVTRR